MANQHVVPNINSALVLESAAGVDKNIFSQVDVLSKIRSERRENPEIIRRAPLHNVASFLQMTPETLSRVRAQVTEEGIK